LTCPDLKMISVIYQPSVHRQELDRRCAVGGLGYAPEHLVY
jgi:hypothetical protein